MEKKALLPAIAYYRYSSHKQGEQSIEGQAAEAQQYAAANGYTIVKEYADRAQTGTNDNREQFQLMLRELDKIRPAALILWKVDRMGRNREEVAFNKYKCKKAGVKIVYTAENIPDSPEGVILASVLEGMAEYYSLQLSQNIKRGLRVSANKCHYTGGGRAFGYTHNAKKEFVIVPEEATIVRRIFEWYTEDGLSMSQIARCLTKDGVKTVHGNSFTNNSVRSLLHNERYKGVYTFNDIRVEGGVPAIIDAEVFDRAQKQMKHNHRIAPSRASSVEYLLTEKLFCGKCGGMMVGTCGTSRNGILHHYYQCNNRRGNKRNKTGCTQRNIRQDAIETLVMEQTKSIIFDEKIIDYITEQTYKYYLEQSEDDAYADALRTSLKDVERALSNLLRAVEAGIFNDTTANRMQELEDQRKQIMSAMKFEEQRSKQRLTKDHIRFFLRHLRNGDFHSTSFQKRIADTFINSMYYFENEKRLVIAYNYSSSEKQTVSMSDIVQTCSDTRALVEISGIEPLTS